MHYGICFVHLKLFAVFLVNSRVRYYVSGVQYIKLHTQCLFTLKALFCCALVDTKWGYLGPISHGSGTQNLVLKVLKMYETKKDVEVEKELDFLV